MEGKESISADYYTKIRRMHATWLTYSPLIPTKLIALLAFLSLIMLTTYFRDIHLSIIQIILLLILCVTVVEYFGRKQHEQGFVEGFIQGMKHPTVGEIDNEYNNFLKNNSKVKSKNKMLK